MAGYAEGISTIRPAVHQLWSKWLWKSSKQALRLADHTQLADSSLVFRFFFPLILRNHFRLPVRNGLLLLSETIEGFIAVVFTATVNRAERLSCSGALFLKREEGIHVVCVSCQGVVKNFAVFFLGSFWGSLHRRFMRYSCLGSGRLSRRC